MGRLKGKARTEAKKNKEAENALPDKRENFDERTEPYIFKDDGEDIKEDDRKTAMEKAVEFCRAKYFPDKTKNILSDQDIEAMIVFDKDHPNYVNRKQRGEDMSGEEKDLFSKAMEYFDYIKYDNDQEVIGLEVINNPTPEQIAERFKEEGAEYLGNGQVLDSSGNAYRPVDSIITGKSSFPNVDIDEKFNKNDIGKLEDLI
jgi:hypothetical protein